MRRRALAMSLALCGLLAAPVLKAQAPATTAGAEAYTPLVVAVTLNGETRPDLFVQRTAAGAFLVRRDDLPSLGLQAAAPTALVLDGEPYVRLDAIAGLQVHIDERSLALALTADPHLLTRTVLHANPRRRRIEPLTSDSAFLNWAVERSSVHGDTDHHDTRLSTEAGLRLGPWLLLGNGNTVQDGQSRRFVRLQTTAQYDRPADLQRWSVGDILTSAPTLAGAVNLGGLTLASHSGLDPYRLRRPLGLVQGQAMLPSDVEIYVDGQRVRTERVQPGEFEIRDLDTQVGARAVQVLVRDPFGRVRQFDYSLYTSDQMLQRGLHDYQYAVGALRRRYGSVSTDYGAPAFTGWHRWGSTDALTLGLHAQGRSGQLNAGPQFTATLGPAGVLSGSAALSQTSGISGRAVLAQYSYYATRWGVGASLRRESPGYAALDAERTFTNRHWGALVYASRNLPGGSVLSISHSVDTVHDPLRVPVPERWQLLPTTGRHATALGYALTFPSLRTTLRTSLTRLHDTRGARTELTVGISVALDGGRLAALSARHTPEGNVQTVQMTQPVPAGEGWGLELGAEHDGTGSAATRTRGAATLNAAHLQLRGDLRQQPGSTNRQDELRLGASGGISWLGDDLYFSRPVQDSYALVQVGDLAGVPVRVNGQNLGETDVHGRLFVPRVNSLLETDIGIDARRIPIDHAVPRVSRRIVLPPRTGAVIDFQVRRLQALVGRLLAPATAGAPQPLARAQVQLQAGGQAIDTTTGLEGEIYLENLPVGRHAGQAQVDGKACQFALEVPASADVILDAGDLRCE